VALVQIELWIGKLCYRVRKRFRSIQWCIFATIQMNQVGR
jgi:hypothetical protein